MFHTAKEVEEFIYSSYVKRYKEIPHGDDSQVRNPHLTRRMLDELGGPDRSQKNIMITGSKGKGSLSVMVAKILEGHGKKVGLFTSPHLRDYRERLRVNGKAISEDALLSLGETLRPIYERIEGELPPHRYIGPVGATAVMAMCWFRDERTDINVVECGRGARYDDVNQIRGFIGGINKIFLEHTGPLGWTIDEVAHHKAGLIKPSMSAVFTAEQSKYADLVLRYEARKFGRHLYHFNEDFTAFDIRLTRQGTLFSVQGRKGVYTDLRLSLLGRHQGENAALAIAICEEALGRTLDNQVLKAVLAGIRWPGRMEILSEHPLTILDGCISKESMAQVQDIVGFLDWKRVITILAIPEDKDYLGVLEMVAEYDGPVIMTHADNDYLKFTHQQVKEGQKIHPVEFRESVAEAVLRARELAKEDDLILCLGTQSFIKDMKIFYGEDTLNI